MSFTVSTATPHQGDLVTIELSGMDTPKSGSPDGAAGPEAVENDLSEQPIGHQDADLGPGEFVSLIETALPRDPFSSLTPCDYTLAPAAALFDGTEPNRVEAMQIAAAKHFPWLSLT